MGKITIERETLEPCPFCGAEAEILTIPEDHPDAGAMFVQCCDSRCVTSSALLYPLMDDVRALLVERWNRRAALAAQPAEPTDAEAVCAEAYQVVGHLLDDLGQFDTERGGKILDNLNEARLVHKDVLPWRSFAQPAPAAVPPEGGIVVSKNEAGQIVCVSRQDEDGQFLSIIAESADAVPPGMALVPIEPTPGIITTGTVALMKASDSDLDATREEIAATYRAMIAAAGDKP